MDCYIYFKADVGHEAAILEQEQVLHSLLLKNKQPGYRLQRRPDAQNGLHTWMEIHRQINAGFEQHLARAYAQTSLPELQSGERHVEYFMDAELCA